MSLLDQLKHQAESVLGAETVKGIEGKVTHVWDMIHDPTHGGLNGLVDQFRKKGLGSVVQSWIGTGPNQPVTTEQVKDVVGPTRLQSLATQLGLPLDQAAQKLTTLLPALVDKLTPNGQLPTPPAAAAPSPAKN
jgi:uncharacterized protein YidB (DUF937 family)